MTTLNIGGKRVKVDDSFLSLSPEQQNATVDEIAVSLGLGSGQADPAQIPQGSRSEGYQNALSQMSGMTQNPARAQYDALPAWQKPLVAASDIVQLTANGITQNYGDKAAAGVRSFFNGKNYEDELAEQRRLTTAARKRSGSAGVAAEVAGAVAGPVKLANKGFTLAGRGGTAAMEGAKGLAARSGLMGIEGAGYGALNASGADEDIGTGALTGLMAGVGGNVVGEGLGAGLNKLFGRSATPAAATVDDLKDAGRQAFKRADDSGLAFNQDGINRLRSNVINDLTERGFDPINEPGIMPVIKRLQSMGDNITLTGLQSLRQVASNGFRPGMKSNNAMVTGIIKRIDELVEAADPSTVLMGANPAAAAAAMKEGRSLWHRASKAETVEKLLGRGELNAGSSGVGGNVENATRQQLKRVLTNETLGRGFNQAEKDAIRKAVLGTKTQNVLRQVGRLSPQGNTLGMVMGGMGTVAAPHIAIPAMIAGYGAKKTAEHLSKRSVNQLVKLITSGADDASMAVLDDAMKLLPRAKRQALSRALMAIGVFHGNKVAAQEKAEQRKTNLVQPIQGR